MTRKTWLWWAVGLTTAALAATFVFERDSLPPFETSGPPPTPRGWQAAPALVAGDGVRGYRDGVAASARFADPWGLALADDGTLYVADAGANNRIRRIAADGQVLTLAGGEEGFLDGQGTAARFHSPSGIALDLAGNLYVADTGNHAIRKLTPDGRVTTVAGNGQPGHRDGTGAQAMFDGPIGVAVDAAGRVYVADSYNDRIRVVQPDGHVSTLAGDGMPGLQDGPGAQARFDTPTDVAVDARGRVWVADAGNAALREIQPDGRVATLSSDAPSTPMALARSHDGLLYVTGLWPSQVYQVDRRGAWHSLLELPPGRRLSRPAGVAMSLGGRVMLADAGAWRVHGLAPPLRSAEVEAAAGNAMASTKPAPTTIAAAGPIGPDPASPLPDTGRRWPLRPQHGWHEVVGTLGEVRGSYSGESRHHLHGGLDIRGDVGQEVVAIADAKVALPLPAWDTGGLAEGFALDDLNYIHMRVGRSARGEVLDPRRFRVLPDLSGDPRRMRIRRGTRFRVGDTLGTINRMAHVHLEVGSSGYQHNASALGFANFADTVPPRIDSVEIIDSSDRPLPMHEGRVEVPRDARDLRIVVEAWDQVDRNLPRRRLGLYALGYQWLDAGGKPVPGQLSPRVGIEFDRMPADPEAVTVAYAPGSGITVHGSAVTRFRYELSSTVRGGRVEAGHWQPMYLPPGDYILRIIARDWSGNIAEGGRDLQVRILPPASETTTAPPGRGR